MEFILLKTLDLIKNKLNPHLKLKGIVLTMFDNTDTGKDYTEVIGTVAYNTTDESILDFTVDIDTIPANTQGAINAVINPLKNGPGDGLPAAANGQRYLILEDIGSTVNTAGGAALWPDASADDLQASKFDIIKEKLLPKKFFDIDISIISVLLTFLLIPRS